MKYTQIPQNTFKEMQLNAGIFLDEFTPSTGTIGNIICATSGGANFKATPTFSDQGEGIDNCPLNMKELKKLDSWEAVLSGTAITMKAATVADFAGAADVSGTHITPRNDLSLDDFHDVWWVGDYSDLNGDSKGGYVAIHLMDALSTDGFQIQSNDKGKGTFPFTYTAHYTMSNQSKVPFEIYIKAGEAEA